MTQIFRVSLDILGYYPLKVREDVTHILDGKTWEMLIRFLIMLKVSKKRSLTTTLSHFLVIWKLFLSLRSAKWKPIGILGKNTSGNQSAWKTGDKTLLQHYNTTFKLKFADSLTHMNVIKIKPSQASTIKKSFLQGSMKKHWIDQIVL